MIASEKFIFRSCKFLKSDGKIEKKKKVWLKLQCNHLENENFITTNISDTSLKIESFEWDHSVSTCAQFSKKTNTS